MYVLNRNLFENKEVAYHFYEMVAENILQDAIRRTPVDTGNLINCYGIIRYGTEPNELMIINTCEYAKYVHELVFNKHENGQAKFLEDAAWEIGMANNVETFINISDNGVACYLDNNKLGYDVNKIKRNADTLFNKYYSERNRWQDAKFKRLMSKWNKAKKRGDDKNANIFMNSMRVLERRRKYEASVASEIFKHFHEQAINSLGLAGGLDKEDKLVASLSKYFSNMNYLKENIDEDLQWVLDKEANIDDDLIGFNDFDFITGRFMNGGMKIPSSGLLKIRVHNSVQMKAVFKNERWEDVE